MMWGTTPPCVKLTGVSGSGIEAPLIGDLSRVSSFRGKLVARDFGSFATLSALKRNPAWLRNGLLAEVNRSDWPALKIGAFDLRQTAWRAVRAPTFA
jgi:hypothetical protein